MGGRGRGGERRNEKGETKGDIFLCVKREEMKK